MGTNFNIIQRLLQRYTYYINNLRSFNYQYEILAICRVLCQNGGKCIKPDLCKCQNGFKGTYCEQDINECETEKPCDHLCFNTNGSYYCRCKNGFILLNDKQSCRKLDQRQIAFEASELEDVDFDELSARVDQLNLVRVTDFITTQLVLTFWQRY